MAKEFEAVTLEQLGLTEDEIETFVKGSRELYGNEQTTETKEGLQDATVRSTG